MIKPLNNPTQEEKKLTDHAFSGFVWMLSGSGLQMLLKIAVMGALARLVSPYEFGIMSVAIMVTEFSKMFAHMGVGPAIIQHKSLKQSHLITGLTLSLIMGAIFATLLIILSSSFATFFHMPELSQVLKATSLVFIIDSFTLIAQALILRNMHFRKSASIEITSYLLGYAAVAITLAYSGFGVWALVAANLSQSLVLTILLLIVQPFPKRLSIDRQSFRELFAFGTGMTIAKVANYFATQGDNLVIGRTLGAAAVGLYGRAYQFMVMPASLFGNALDKSLFPAMSKVQDDRTRLGKAYLTGVSVIAMIAIPASVAMVLLAPEVVLVILGKKWTGVVMPLQILACSLLFRMSYKMSDSLARAIGAVYQRAWRQIVYAALVIGGSYIGQLYGIAGVAVGVAVALVINYLLMAHLSITLTRISWREFFMAHSSGFFAGCIAVAVLVLATNFSRSVTTSPLLILIMTVGLATLVVAPLIVVARNKLLNDDLRALADRLIVKRLQKNI